MMQSASGARAEDTFITEAFTPGVQVCVGGQRIYTRIDNETENSFGELGYT